MSKHSFAPKLTETEARLLSYITDEGDRPKLGHLLMFRRGLIQWKKDEPKPVHLTRRGKLMLQRYQVDKNVRWLASHREVDS